MVKTSAFLGVLVALTACSNNPRPGDFRQSYFNAVTSNSVTVDDANYFRTVVDMVSRIPGVEVSPGRIMIRGISTINGRTDPLIVVDDMPLSEFVPAYTTLSMMNPHDIAKIEVLKDAYAAIWGVRGSNGVIVITTRR